MFVVATKWRLFGGSGSAVVSEPLARGTSESHAGSGDAAAGNSGAVPQEAPPPQPKGWPSKRLPHDTRYFIMKSFSMRDIGISLKQGIWATQRRNEQHLNAAFEVRAHATRPSRTVAASACPPRR